MLLLLSNKISMAYYSSFYYSIPLIHIMKAIALQLILALALMQALKPIFYETMQFSKSEDCQIGCEECWNNPQNSCLTCSKGYIFGMNDTNQCYKYASRQIIGYGRQCAVCGQGNYVDENGMCNPCPYKCQACILENSEVKCTKCKPNIGETDGYLLGEDCSCTYGDTVHNTGCYCNNITKYIAIDPQDSNGKQACENCDHCTRHYKNCRQYMVNLKCEDVEKYTYDPTDYEPELFDDPDSNLCCKECDISCKTCNGTSDDDCITCRNEDLFEMVEANHKCMCVCDADWVPATMYTIHGVFESHKCECAHGTVKTDTCIGKAVCDEGIRFQCLCPEGKKKGPVNADGSSECIN
jgi:hypothetical protein